MSKKFQNILDTQEKQDKEMIESEAKIIREMRAQLANCDEILSFMQKNGYSVADFFADNDFPRDYPIVPVRFADEFSVHKHTVSSRPYFHEHTFYEILYVHRGKCTQSFPGGKPPLLLKEKQLCLLRPGAVHLIENCGKYDVVLKLVIPEKIFVSTNVPPPSFDENIAVFTETGEQTEWCISKLLDESRRADEYREEAIKDYLSLLFIGLRRAPQETDQEFAERLADYLQKDLQNASLKGFAAALGYSEGYTGRLVKQNHGKSFSETLQAYRLQKAAELLEDSSLPIDDVAAEVGYQNASGFYKQFYGHFGLTPGAYRKMYR